MTRSPIMSSDAASRALSELRIALLAGPRVSSGIEAAHAGAIGDGFADCDFALVESSALGDPARTARAIETAERARQAGSPSALWITSTRDAERAPGELVGAFDRVFAAHPHAAEIVAAASRSRPSVLLPAASPDALSADPSEQDRVVYMGGYSGSWPPAARARFDAFLRPALALGLRIVAVRGSEPDGLPWRYRKRLVVVDSPRAAIEALAEFRVLVAIPDAGEEEAVPEAALDALGCGVRVVMPHNFAASIAFPRLATFVPAGAKVQPILAECMQEDGGYPRRAAAARRAVGHTHTYAHRLATIAAGLGFSALP
jgi:hypothetical protein